MKRFLAGAGVASLCFAGTAAALEPLSPKNDLNPPCQSVLSLQGAQERQIRVLNAPDSAICPPFELQTTFMAPPIRGEALLPMNVQIGAEFMVSGVNNSFINFFKRTDEPVLEDDPSDEYVAAYAWFDNARGYEKKVPLEFLAPQFPSKVPEPKYLGLYKGKVPEDLPEGQYLLRFGNSQGGPAVAKISVVKELPGVGQELPDPPEVPQTPIGGILDDDTVIQPEGGNPPIVVGKKPVAAAIDGGGAINNVLPIVYVEKRGNKWAVLSQFGRNRDGVFSVRANLSGTSKKMRGACNWDYPEMVQCRAWLTQRGKWRLTWSVDGERVYARTVIVK